MPPVRVQFNSGSTTNSLPPLNVPFDTGNTAGNCILVWIGIFAETTSRGGVGNLNAPTTLIDSQGNSYTKIFDSGPDPDTGDSAVYVYVSFGIKAGANTVEVNNASTNIHILDIDTVIIEYSGVVSFDVAGSNFEAQVDSGATISDNGITTSQAVEVVVVAVYSSNASTDDVYTPDSGWVELVETENDDSESLAVADQITNATGVYSATWTKVSPDFTDFDVWAVIVGLVGSAPPPPPANAGITISAGATTLGFISSSGTEASFTQALYKYANLTLPYNPNDPGLQYTYDNSTLSPQVFLSASFFNLLNEPSTPVVFNVGTTAFTTTTTTATGIFAVSGALECLDVRLFGAKGDGVTDDTVAVQAALNKAHANYLALVATGLAGTPGVPLSVSGMQLYPDSVGVPGPQGSTVVCIPSGVYCRVFPRTWDFANVGVPPSDGVASQYPSGGTGLCALFIDDGVTLQVDGALILGFDQEVLTTQATVNATLGTRSVSTTMWILENKNAFVGGPFGVNQRLTGQKPESWLYALQTWEVGPRNIGIRVTGEGFFDCGGRANTTEFQTGGWLNECRGGAIRLCKCDNSQIDGVTVQNFVSNQGIYWGHSTKCNLFDVLFEHSYGGAVFANLGAQGTPLLLPSAPFSIPGPEFGNNQWSQTTGENVSSFTITITSEATGFHPAGLAEGDVIFVVVEITQLNNPIVCSLQSPSIDSVTDTMGNEYLSLGSQMGWINARSNHACGESGLDPALVSEIGQVFYCQLADAIAPGDTLVITVDISQPSDPGTAPCYVAIGASPTYGLLDLDQALSSSYVAGTPGNFGPPTPSFSATQGPITTGENEVLLTFVFNVGANPGGNAFPLDPLGWEPSVFLGSLFAGGDLIRGDVYYGGSQIWAGLSPSDTYEVTWNNNAVGGCGLQPWGTGVVMAAFFATQPATVIPGNVIPGAASSFQSDFGFFALVFDVMRQSTAYSNRFTDVNSAIGEFACFHTDFHDNIANECGMAPYGIHYATDNSFLFDWTFSSELNVDGNRYANTYSNNRDLVWQPGMWITDGADLRTMTPTNYQVGNHIWLALPKGLSVIPGPDPVVPGYPYYAGITGGIEPRWASPTGTLSINPTWGGNSGPYPYVLDAVVPVSGAFVGFWSQGVSGSNFLLPTSDPNWGNNLGQTSYPGSSSATIFLNGVQLTQGTDWFPGTSMGTNNPDFIHFSNGFTASPFDIITVNMNTQVAWIDLGAVNIACPWVPPCFFVFGGYGNGLPMSGYRMLNNHASDNYLDGIGFSGLDHGQISHSEILRNTGYGIVDLTQTTLVGAIPSIDISIIDNNSQNNTCGDLDVSSGIAGLSLDNPEVAPATITRGGVTQTFFNIATDEIPSGTINGSNVTFTLAHSPQTGTLDLYLNGVLQTSGYTLVGNVITMEIAPNPGSDLLADYEW